MKSRWWYSLPRLSFTISRYNPSFLVGLLDSIQSPYWTDVSEYLLALPWVKVANVFVLTYQVLFILLRWFVWWVVSGRTTVVFLDDVSRICSKQHVAFLCSSRFDFSLGVSLESIWCINIVVLALRTWKKSSLFHRTYQSWLITSQ